MSWLNLVENHYSAFDPHYDTATKPFKGQHIHKSNKWSDVKCHH